METLDNELLKQIVQNTDSSLILFFVILGALMLPVGYLIHKHVKHRHEVECKRRAEDREREKMIIDVVTANTEVMVGLKNQLDTNNTVVNASLVRIHERIDNHYATLQAIKKRLRQ